MTEVEALRADFDNLRCTGPVAAVGAVSAGKGQPSMAALQEEVARLKEELDRARHSAEQMRNESWRDRTTRTEGSRERRCYRCGQEGHYANSCQNPLTCYFCKKPGHLKRDCAAWQRQQSVPGGVQRGNGGSGNDRDRGPVGETAAKKL